jgi:hypothetical protein
MNMGNSLYTPISSAVTATLDKNAVTPSAYDGAVKQLQKCRAQLEKYTMDLDNKKKRAYHEMDLERLAVRQIDISVCQDQLDKLKMEEQRLQNKVTSMEQEYPTVMRRHPVAKKITLTFHYRDTVYTIKVDLNDTMSDLPKELRRFSAVKFSLNRFLGERLTFYQDGQEAVFPSQRWLIAYEAEQSLDYDIVIQPMSRPKEWLADIRQKMGPGHSMSNKTDEEILATFDEWFIHDCAEGEMYCHVYRWVNTFM